MRPTDLDAMEMQYASKKEAVLGVSKFVVDWKGFTELDFYSGGTSDSVPFDQALFIEWIKDKPDLWGDLINGVMSAYKKHREKAGESSKNS